MNRVLMVIRYRKATHVGLTGSFTRIAIQVFYLTVAGRDAQTCY